MCFPFPDQKGAGYYVFGTPGAAAGRSCQRLHGCTSERHCRRLSRAPAAEAWMTAPVRALVASWLLISCEDRQHSACTAGCALHKDYRRSQVVPQTVLSDTSTSIEALCLRQQSHDPPIPTWCRSHADKRTQAKASQPHACAEDHNGRCRHVQGRSGGGAHLGEDAQLLGERVRERGRAKGARGGAVLPERRSCRQLLQAHGQPLPHDGNKLAQHLRVVHAQVLLPTIQSAMAGAVWDDVNSSAVRAGTKSGFKRQDECSDCTS